MINVKSIEEQLTPYTNRRVVNILQNDKMIFYIYQFLVYYDFYLKPFNQFKDYVFKKSMVKVLKDLKLWKSVGNYHNKKSFCDERLALLILSMFSACTTMDKKFDNFLQNIEVTKNQKHFKDSLSKINADLFKVSTAINKSFGIESRILLSLKSINKIKAFENEIVKYIDLGEIKTESEIIFLTRIILK